MKVQENCGSVRIRGGNPKIVWWIDEVKAAFRKKEVSWKDILGARDGDARESKCNNILPL